MSEIKDHSDTGSQFRQMAGLPPRESDAPADVAEPAPELEETVLEPTGDEELEVGDPSSEPQPGADEDGFGGDAPEPADDKEGAEQ